MPSFHIDPNSGDPRSCAKPNECDWGKPHEHYESQEAARAAYEASMQPLLFKRFHKRGANGEHVMELRTPIR